MAVVAKAVVELSALNIKTITLHSTFSPSKEGRATKRYRIPLRNPGASSKGLITYAQFYIFLGRVGLYTNNC